MQTRRDFNRKFRRTTLLIGASWGFLFMFLPAWISRGSFELRFGPVPELRIPIDVNPASKRFFEGDPMPPPPGSARTQGYVEIQRAARRGLFKCRNEYQLLGKNDSPVRLLPPAEEAALTAAERHAWSRIQRTLAQVEVPAHFDGAYTTTIDRARFWEELLSQWVAPVVLAFAAAATITALAYSRRHRLRARGLCEKCKYDISGLVRCTECGLETSQ